MIKYFLVKKTIPGTGLNKNNIVIQEVDGSIVLKTGNNEFLDVSFPSVPPIDFNHRQYNQPHISKCKQSNKKQKYNTNNSFH